MTRSQPISAHEPSRPAARRMVLSTYEPQLLQYRKRSQEFTNFLPAQKMATMRQLDEMEKVEEAKKMKAVVKAISRNAI
jgi:hypothetical protein